MECSDEHCLPICDVDGLLLHSLLHSLVWRQGVMGDAFGPIQEAVDKVTNVVDTATETVSEGAKSLGGAVNSIDADKALSDVEAALSGAAEAILTGDLSKIGAAEVRRAVC